jgi:hypothetical protein
MDSKKRIYIHYYTLRLIYVAKRNGRETKLNNEGSRATNWEVLAWGVVIKA